MLFASDSPWVWEAEKNFKLLRDQNPNLVSVKKGRLDDVEMVEDAEKL